MNLLEKLERKWMMHETLHQLKDTLKRYGMDLTTPLSRIDKDYSSGHYFSTALSLIHYKYSCNEYWNLRNQKAWLRLTTQAKDIKILDNFFDETVNRDNDSIKKINEQECDFINFCGTCLLDAGYVSGNENAKELRCDWKLSEITKHRNGWMNINYTWSNIWTNAIFNNEVKDINVFTDEFLECRQQTVLVRDEACECYYRRDRLYTLNVKGNLILNESFTPKMLFKGLHGKNMSSEFNVKQFCFAAGLRSSITWDAHIIGLDDDGELVWEMFLSRNKFGMCTNTSENLCSFILKNSELKDFIKHAVDGQMKDYMSAVREVRKVQVKQTASEWKC